MADALAALELMREVTLLGRLGPHTTGKGCLYVKRLDDLDRDVLVELVERGWARNATGD